jgi:resuscitation-promoting factor RpfB
MGLIRHRSIAFVAAVGVLAPTPAVALATDGSTGGSSAPGGPRSKESSRRHKHVKLPKVMKKIAICESGDNPRAVSPSGQYRGKWQFAMETWREWGGKGDPAKASEYRQDTIAMRLYRAEGTRPWPECARRVRDGEFG